MRHKKSHLDVKQEHSKEPRTLCLKKNSEGSNHPLLLNEVSLATKQEPYELQQAQSSNSNLDPSETHVEECTLSCKKETKKDTDMLMQKPSLCPGIPAQESKPPLISDLMGDSSKVPKYAPADLHLRQSPDPGHEERTYSVKREILLPLKSFEGVPALHSDKQKMTQSTQPKKNLEKLQPGRSHDTGGCSSQSDLVTTPSLSEKLSIVAKDAQLNNLEPSQCLHARSNAVLSKEEKGTKTKGELVCQDPVEMSTSGVGVPIHQPSQENYTYSTKFEKVEKLRPRRNPDLVVQEPQSTAESNLSKVPDKGLDDGYNWRKYGQKLVKGNKFIRSYYRCTYPNCQAKKQVERSHDGCKMDVNYLGNHHHQKPQQNPQVTSVLQVRMPEMSIVSASKTNAEPVIDHGGTNQRMGPTETSPHSTVARSGDRVTEVSCSNDDNKDKDDHPDPKRQKRDMTFVNYHAVNKSNCDLRHVVQTLSEVDIVNDGYCWRKYGQKLVKSNPNPRSYYRCSFTGCPVKKHVERASHDSKVVITTYEGKHDHNIPTSRNVNKSMARGDANIMTPNGESSSKPEESKPVSLEMVVDVRAI